MEDSNTKEVRDLDGFSIVLIIRFLLRSLREWLHGRSYSHLQDAIIVWIILIEHCASPSPFGSRVFFLGELTLVRKEVAVDSLSVEDAHHHPSYEIALALFDTLTGTHRTPCA